MTLDLYFWPTPNGWKISIALEEMGLEYATHLVNISAGDQFKPAFLTISPNNRMPAIVDADGPDSAPVSVFESGAILQYLARKTGRFGGNSERGRIAVEQWLMWQMGGLGPMAGQTHHFLKYAPEDIAYAKARYRDETARLYGVLDRRLAKNEYLAGDFYSIADMACWPWTRPSRRQGVNKDDFPNVKRWFDKMSAWPGVQAGMELLVEHRGSKAMDKSTRDLLFGKGQFERD